jgi:hypothetical protein
MNKRFSDEQIVGVRLNQVRSRWRKCVVIEAFHSRRFICVEETVRSDGRGGGEAVAGVGEGEQPVEAIACRA